MAKQDLRELGFGEDSAIPVVEAKHETKSSDAFKSGFVAGTRPH